MSYSNASDYMGDTPQMNDTNLNTAIAEWCGFRIEPPKEDFPYWSVWFGDKRTNHFVWEVTIPDANNCLEWGYIPLYTEDRNALHSVIMKMDDGQWDKFIMFVHEATGKSETGVTTYHVLRLSTRQLAVCLAKSVGVFKEDKP